MEKKNNFGKKRKKKGKLEKKMKKYQKKKEKEKTLWITVVIHSDLGAGVNNDSPTPFRYCYNRYLDPTNIICIICY